MSVTPGEVVRGTVKHVAVFGIFFDCAGEDVLVLIPETSWIPCYASCQELAQPGDEFPVKVLRKVEGREQYVGSLKAVFPHSDPWSEKWELQAGQTLPARIVRRVEHADRCGGGPGYLLELRPAAYVMLCAPEGNEFEIGESREVVITTLSVAGHVVRIELKQ